jgi:hypothetical protein
MQISQCVRELIFNTDTFFYTGKRVILKRKNAAFFVLRTLFKKNTPEKIFSLANELVFR